MMENSLFKSDVVCRFGNDEMPTSRQPTYEFEK